MTKNVTGTNYQLPSYQDKYMNKYASSTPQKKGTSLPYLQPFEKYANDKFEKKQTISPQEEPTSIDKWAQISSENPPEFSFELMRDLFMNFPKTENDKYDITKTKELWKYLKDNVDSDELSQQMNENTPEFAFNMIPDNYLSFAANTTMLNKAKNEELLRDLPRRPDGSYDTARIKAALLTAVNTIKAENGNLEERLNFGTYKNLVNGVDAWAFALGPEISGCLENAGIINAQRMFSFQDLNVGNIIQNFCDKDSKAYDLIGKMSFKSSFEIKDNIAKQNQELDELLALAENLDLETNEGLECLFNKYREVTKTGFSCQDIENYQKVKMNAEINKEKKMEEYMKAFGTVDNAVDTTNCEIFTMVMYEVIFKMLIPKIIKNCVPYGKYFGPIIPAGVEVAETLTSGTKDGQVINTDKLTVQEAARVAVDGFAHYLMVSDFDLGFLSKIYHDFPGSDKIPTKFLRWNYKNAFRGTRSGAQFGIAMLTSSAWDPIFGQKIFDNGANKWERTGAAIFHCATGYVFIPSAIYHRNDSKKDEKDDET